MRKINLWFPLFLCVLAALSCKTDRKADVNTVEKPVAISEELRLTRNMSDDLTENQLIEMHVEADQLINQRWKESDKKSWAILTSKIWEYNMIYNGSEMSKPGYLKGQWIVFNDDLTYEYGHMKDKLGSGKYHYSPDTGLLIMKDNSRAVKPNELTVQPGSEELIIVGTSRFGDNNMQGRVSSIPARY